MNAAIMFSALKTHAAPIWACSAVVVAEAKLGTAGSRAEELVAERLEGRDRCQ